MFGLFKRKKPEPVEATPDYATLYIADPSLIDSVLQAMPGVLSYERFGDGNTAAGLRLRLKAGKVVMNFMPQDRIAEHLAGMSAMVEQEVRDRTRLPYIQQRIGQVRFVIGCVAPQGFDDKGAILETLMRLNCELNGLFFLGDSLFDKDATPLAGSACDE